MRSTISGSEICALPLPRSGLSNCMVVMVLEALDYLLVCLPLCETLADI